MNMNNGNSTHVKFGGFDTEGIFSQNENDLTLMQTSSISSWSLDLQSASIGNTEFVHPKVSFSDSPRYVLFELTHPYIYIPLEDFKAVAIAINEAYGVKLCGDEVCYFKNNCKKITDVGKTFRITVTDSTTR